MSGDGLTAGAVARRLGVAVTTLRTWHQRYDLGPSEHVPGRHRRYTPADLERLEVMRRLTSHGVAPAAAAAWARRMPVGSGPDDQAEACRQPAEPADVAGQVEAGGGEGGRGAGGQTIPVGRAGAPARGLARAAMRLDAAAIRDILIRTIDRQGVAKAWDTVMVPVLVGIGERHAATQRFVEVEHLVSRCITEVLGAFPGRVPPGIQPRVLLVCADDEQHSLPLEALSAALAELGTPSRLLGARMPPQALADAIARTGPEVVVIWAHTAETAEPSQLTRLLDGASRPLVVAAAGPGWNQQDLPADITPLNTLGDALRVIRAVVTDAPPDRD